MEMTDRTLQEDQRKLFKRFSEFQGGSLTGDHSEGGLGLWRKCVVLHCHPT
jgi:hypothetical protein